MNKQVSRMRVGMEKSREKYQIISVDAYRPPYIPWHMTTREFFEIARSHMTDDGVLVINVGRGPTDRRLVDAFSSTLARSTLPAVGASTWAAGSQVWNGNMGTLTAKAVKNAAKAQSWNVRLNWWFMISSTSKVLPAAK